ncbi:hypothetical protein [Tenacibaculum sp. 190524A05c]|uniref:Uncharacterized protein n=1 Tax=Tenacibaculum platacis TaxID=3137852 RepID=A0ABM9NT64_9FLAO
MSFKVQIENELHKNYWKVILIDSLNEWWEDEHWQIQWKYHMGEQIYIQFINDFEDTLRIREINAIRNLNDKNSIITSICMNKRKFNEKLKEFISEIEEYRKSNENKNIRKIKRNRTSE